MLGMLPISILGREEPQQFGDIPYAIGSERKP